MQLSPPERQAVADIWTHGLTVSEVWREYQKTHPNRVITCSAALVEYLESRRRAGRSHNYVRQLRIKLGAFSAAFGPQRSLAEVATFDHPLFLGQWSAPTASTRLQRLRGFYKWAEKMGYIANDPTATIERMSHTPSAVSVLTNAQCAALLDACIAIDRDLFWWYWLALGLGVRVCEIPGAEFADGMVVVPAGSSKTRRRRPISVPPFLAPLPPKGAAQNLRRILFRHYRGIVSNAATERWVDGWTRVLALYHRGAC